MDQYCTGWCRFRTNIRYRHMTVTSVFVFLARFIEHVIHTHMIDMRCIQANDKMITLLKPDCTVAEKGHHKDDYIVYCVRNNISMGVWSGPRDKYVGAPTYYVWAPTCYAGPEPIMSGPWLIMSEPLLMSGTRDNYGGAPFLLSEAPR